MEHVYHMQQAHDNSTTRICSEQVTSVKRSQLSRTKRKMSQNFETGFHETLWKSEYHTMLYSEGLERFLSALQIATRNKVILCKNRSFQIARSVKLFFLTFFIT